MDEYKYPSVEVTKMTFGSSHFVTGGKKWSAMDLYKQAEKEKCEVHKVPLAFIDMRAMPFNLKDFDDFVFHMRRALDTDLSHPIIFDSCGCIADGWHRVAKAVIEKKRTIKAYRLKDMPDTYIDVE